MTTLLTRRDNRFSSVPVVLSIAGSDSGGGAGIQADIKAISATGSYACTAITAITSQNTLGVDAIFPVPVSHIETQLDAVFRDLSVAAVKVGMLADSDIICAVVNKLEQYQARHIVVDPVMVATSGDRLLENSALEALRDRLLPLADIITPNLPEASTLLGVSMAETKSDIETMIEPLRQMGRSAILLKGGHFDASPVSRDFLILPDQTRYLDAPRVKTENTHGTGCTLSSAIASYLAQGFDIPTSVEKAKRYITQAISHSDNLNVGHGHGPVHHFYWGRYDENAR